MVALLKYRHEDVVARQGYFLRSCRACSFPYDNQWRESLYLQHLQSAHSVPSLIWLPTVSSSCRKWLHFAYRWALPIWSKLGGACMVNVSTAKLIFNSVRHVLSRMIKCFLEMSLLARLAQNCEWWKCDSPCRQCDNHKRDDVRSKFATILWSFASHIRSCTRLRKTL